jgi:hypothetical protein
MITVAGVVFSITIVARPRPRPRNLASTIMNPDTRCRRRDNLGEARRLHFGLHRTSSLTLFARERSSRAAHRAKARERRQEWAPRRLATTISRRSGRTGSRSPGRQPPTV